MLFIRYFITLVVTFSVALLPAQDNNLLQAKDVQTIMQQIMSQHVKKKAVTVEILRDAFRVYIEQFDPECIYLLESEVQPYLGMSDAEMQKVIAQYRQNDFSAYSKLNVVIQKAIHRAREYRAAIEKDPGILFKSNAPIFTEEKRPYAKTLSELHSRIREDITGFLRVEEYQNGGKEVLGHQKEVLAIYETEMRDFEDEYLFENEKGQPLTVENQQHLFFMHVLKAIAKSLDSHTSFFDEDEAFDMKTRLEKEFYGFGIIPKRSYTGIVVGKMFPGSPAENSGMIKVDDQILEIDGQEVKDLSFEEVMEKLEGGDKGTSVSLLLRRKGRDVSVRLQSSMIVINEDRVDMSAVPYGDGVIGVITLHSFYKGQGEISSENDVRDAIDKLNQQDNLRGLVLDLRENSGGFLTQAVKVAGLFITNGVVVISKYSDGQEHFYRDMDGRVFYDGPLVVLTSKATASAAEIVAQALQDYGVAVVVGDEQTYGKGTIQSQTVTKDSGKSFFKVTVGKYYTVSGNTPQLKGVKSDIVVPSYLFYEKVGEEYLDSAVEGSDHIVSAYSDKLPDIDPGLRPWYLRYYTPTLQHRKLVWRQMLPTLKSNSQKRIAKDFGYQQFLAGGIAYFDVERDPQLQEAVNIVKDMIQLGPRARGSGLVEVQ